MNDDLFERIGILFLGDGEIDDGHRIPRGRSLYLEFFTTPTICEYRFGLDAAWPRGEFAVRQGSAPFLTAARTPG